MIQQNSSSAVPSAVGGKRSIRPLGTRSLSARWKSSAPAVSVRVALLVAGITKTTTGREAGQAAARRVALQTRSRFGGCLLAKDFWDSNCDASTLLERLRVAEAEACAVQRFGDMNLPREALMVNASMVKQYGCTPLVCFVNSKAGGKQGAWVKEGLKDWMNPYQIFDLTQIDTETPLRIFADLPKYNILVCGGDGTVGSVLSFVHKVHTELNSSSNIPGIAILPIGTGNDLAVATGWGRGFRDGKKLPVLLEKVQASQLVAIDRWEIRINGIERDVFQNYLGIGIDASIAKQCAKFRRIAPWMHFSRWLNRKYYGLMGFFDFVQNKYKDFTKQVDIHVDGKKLILPPKTKGIVLLNLQNYGGGSQIWFDDELHRFAPASISDGLFEVIAIKGPCQLGGVKMGISRPQKIAQGARISIKTSETLPIQADGEPWMQTPSLIDIQSTGQNAYMLRPRSTHDIVDATT